MDERGKRDREDLVERFIEMKSDDIERAVKAFIRALAELWADEQLKKREAENLGAAPVPVVPMIQKAPPSSRRNRRARTSKIVRRIAIVSGPEGVEVHFDDHLPWLNLGKGDTLPALIRALASKRGSHARHDGLVPVKSQAELLERIAPIRGQPMVHRQALRAHIMRLRKALENAGLPPGLVETIGDGYRLRLAADGQVTLDGSVVV
jgi:hypothetical protein